MEVKEITSQQIWQEYLDKAKPKTFLHDWQWGEFNQANGKKIFRLGLYDTDKLLGVTLIIKEVAKRGSYFLCPHGPLINWDDKNQLVVLIAYLKKLAQQEKVSFIKICPIAANTEKNKQLVKDLKFRSSPLHVHPELSWMLDVTPDEETLLKNMRKNCRYAIKKAVKDGVTVETSTELSSLEKFNELYKVTAVRHNFTPFSMNYIKKEFEIYHKQNKALFLFGKYQGEIISGAMIVFSNGSTFYHHGASIHKFEKIATSQIVQWEAIKQAKARGYKYYNFWGIAPDNQPKHPFAGITLFKKGFGGFPEEYLHAQDYVINYKYWFNYIIEQVRRIKRGF